MVALSAGVTAWLEAAGGRPPSEFDLLDYRPEPWSPVDSLALEVMPKIGSIDKDEQAIIVDVDERICRILGYRREELIGRRSLELLHPDDQGSAIAAWPWAAR